MSEPPSIIRQDKLHEVKVTEGSQVAASRSIDPAGPQVRRTLPGDASAGEDEQTSELAVPPPLATTIPADPLAVPEPLAAEKQPALQLPPELAQAHSPPDSIVFERSVRLDDHQQVDPLAPQPAAQDGLVFQRALQDHVVDLPPLPPSDAASEPPRIEPRLLPEAASGPEPTARVIPTHRVKLPPREGTSDSPPVPPLAAIRRPIDALPPVPLAQAQEQISLAAADVQARISETLGTADSGWVEMDFPARVIRLKIENDKVRTKLDQLSALGAGAPH
jgi:hypothetical protein